MPGVFDMTNKTDEALGEASGGHANFQRAKKLALDGYVFAAITEQDCDYTRASASAKSMAEIQAWIKEDDLTNPTSCDHHTCAIFNAATNVFHDVDTGRVVFDGDEASGIYVRNAEIAILSDKGAELTASPEEGNT
jgi:hypothetical protein